MEEDLLPGQFLGCLTDASLIDPAPNGSGAALRAFPLIIKDVIIDITDVPDQTIS